MALASASKSKSLEQFPACLDKQMDGDAGKFIKYFHELVSRIDGYEEKEKDRLFNEMDPLFSVRDNKISMVMKEVQKVSMNMMTANIEDILEEYPIDPEQTYLSVSGGYALNCPTNSYLLEKYHFKDFITAPCVNDSGISMGMALFYFWKNMGTFSFKLQTPYLYSTMTKVTDRAKTKVTENDTLKAGINAKGSGNICLGENEY